MKRTASLLLRTKLALGLVLILSSCTKEEPPVEYEYKPGKFQLTILKDDSTLARQSGSLVVQATRPVYNLDSIRYLRSGIVAGYNDFIFGLDTLPFFGTHLEFFSTMSPEEYDSLYVPDLPSIQVPLIHPSPLYTYYDELTNQAHQAYLFLNDYYMETSVDSIQIEFTNISDPFTGKVLDKDGHRFRTYTFEFEIPAYWEPLGDIILKHEMEATLRMHPDDMD